MKNVLPKWNIIFIVIIILAAFNINDAAAQTKNVQVTLALHGLWNNATSTHSPIAVSFELRSGTSLISSTLTGRKTCMVGENGQATIDFSDIADGNYYLVVRAPGYLPLAMPESFSLSNSGFSYNFTTASTQAVGGINAMILPTGSSVWQARCGDFNNSRSVTATDANMFSQNNGRSLTTLVPAP